MKKFLLALPTGIPSLVMILIVAYFSLAEDPIGASRFSLFEGADKVAHVILYFVTALVFILDYAKHVLPHHTKLNKELMCMATAITLGIVMEVAQLYFTSGRSYEFSDWFADIAGAVLAFLFYHFWYVHYFRQYLYHSMQHHYHYNKRKK